MRVAIASGYLGNPRWRWRGFTEGLLLLLLLLLLVLRSVCIPQPELSMGLYVTSNLLLHLKQLSKPISSDLLTYLLYLLNCVCVSE